MVLTSRPVAGVTISLGVRGPVSNWIGGCALETLEKRLRVDRREIAYLRFIFEGYDGLAVLTTIDPQAGLVALHVPPGCESDVEEILQGLREEVLIEQTQA